MSFSKKQSPVGRAPRKPAGGWLLQKLNGRIDMIIGLWYFTMGFLFSTAILLTLATVGWLPFWFEISMAIAVGSVLVMLLLFFAPWKWSISNLRKGMVGEQRVGQGIEYALTAAHCAVAHGVISIPGVVGDVDHLVATPKGLFVIETKYQRVPKTHFSDVLLRLSANVQAVRRWAPNNTLVRACLVLVEDDPKQDSYLTDGETILVRSGKSFRKMLRDDSREPLSTDNGLSRLVWDIGRR